MVISQVYGSGGNSGAPFNADFIELFNRGSSAADITGWSVQYDPPTSTTGTFEVTPICPIGTCSIPAGGYFLVKGAGGATGASFTADVTGTTNLSATGGKVALVTNTTPLDAALSCATLLPGTVDFVGYGNANCFEGAAATPAPSNTNAAVRKSGGCQDTNDNAADFFVAAPAPRNSASPLNDCSAADLGVTKTDSPDPVVTGSDVTYSIVVTNNGPGVAPSVVVTDNLPANVTFVSCASTGSGVCSGSGNNRTVTFSSLASGESATITLVATANSAGGTTITNTATVSSATSDSNTANNSATEATTVQAVAPAITIDDVSALEGDSGTTIFTFTVHLSTVAPAGGSTFNITTADGTAQDDNPATEDSDYVAKTLALETIPAGQQDYQFSVTVNGDNLVEPNETFFVNVTPVSGATLSGGDGQGLGTITNDDDSLLVISQIYGGGGNVGATFTHDFIEVFNRGATTVNLAGWSVQYNGAADTDAWAATPLCPNGPCLLAPGQYFLIQQAQGAGGTTALPTPDATGTTNLAAASGKVALLSHTTALTGACPADPGIADVVGYGGTATCFEGTAPAPAPANTTADFRRAGGCTDTNDNAADFLTDAPNPRNTSSALNDCSAADVAITKSDSPDPVITGLNVTYTIVVTNNGPAEAQSVVVSDDLPPSVTFVSCGSTGVGVCGGTLNSRTITFTSLASGASETITLVATANGAGGTTITNTATVASSTNDPTPANNSAQTTTTVANPPSADLSISKADSPDPVTPGGTLTYTLTLTNGGPDSAQSVVVTDTLSSDVTFVNCSSNQGGVCGGTSTSPTVSFSSLANGVTATITIQVTVSNSLTTGAVITNAASVTSTTADPVSGNNSDSEDTTVQVATPTVTSVVVSPATPTINRGGTQQFAATAFNGVNPVPGATFTWGSSNTDVATIDTNGLATGVGIGTTTITATTSDGIGGNVSGTAMLTVQVPLVINEILADPPGSVTTDLAGDANRDLTRNDDDDEFVELLNNSNAAVNVSGVVVADATSNRFTFPANTTVAAGQAVVIFGGGSPPVSDPAFGGALIFTTTTLSLSNTADTVTVKLNVSGGDVVIDTHTYGSEVNNNQSITQSPDAEVGSAGGSFVQHTTATNTAGRVFSPGTRADGTPFGSPAITRIEVLPATAAINIGATQLFTGHAYSNVGGPEIEVANVSFIWDSSDITKATVAPTTGQTTTATALASGSSTIRARAGGQQGTATLTVNAPPPTLIINNVPQAETNGVTTFTFQVSLSSPAPAGGVTFDIATADDTAQDDNPVTEDNDYVARTLVGQTILEGNSTYDFAVTVNGDSVIEPDETFFVNVTSVTGATVGDGQGLGTIQNDDSVTLNVNDVVLSEGNVGPKTFQFTVSLSLPAPAGGVTFDIATQDNTATVDDGNPSTLSDNDYVANSLTAQTILAGQQTKTFDVTVNGDLLVESDETFFVNVTNVVGATPGDTQGQGTIQNDDTPLLVISQVYGGGGLTGATYTHDFIEIFNRGTTTVDFSVTAFSVQYAGAQAAFGSSKTDITSGSVAPGKYFLVQQASGGGVGAALPAPDATGTINLNATAGKVALVSSTVLLAGNCPGDDAPPPTNPSGATIVDFVGYGFGTSTSNPDCFEGTGRVTTASGTQNNRSIIRDDDGCEDTDDNATNFTYPPATTPPVARNQATAANPCP